MKLYLSGPMSGIPDLNRPLASRAKALLEIAGYVVISPWDLDINLDHQDGQITPEERAWLLRQDFAVLAGVDAIALLPGWEKSIGANIEVLVGQLLNMPALGFEKFLAEAAVYDPDAFYWPASFGQIADLGIVLNHLEALQ